MIYTALNPYPMHRKINATSSLGARLVSRYWHVGWHATVLASALRFSNQFAASAPHFTVHLHTFLLQICHEHALSTAQLLKRKLLLITCAQQISYATHSGLPAICHFCGAPHRLENVARILISLLLSRSPSLCQTREYIPPRCRNISRVGCLPSFELG